MHEVCFSASSTPTMQFFHPPQCNSPHDRRLNRPIALLVAAAANHNQVRAHERRNFAEAVLFGAVATALFRRVHPPPPVDVRGGRFHFLLQREDEHDSVTASLKVI